MTRDLKKNFYLLKVKFNVNVCVIFPFYLKYATIQVAYSNENSPALEPFRHYDCNFKQALRKTCILLVRTKALNPQTDRHVTVRFYTLRHIVLRNAA